MGTGNTIALLAHKHTIVLKNTRSRSQTHDRASRSQKKTREPARRLLFFSHLPSANSNPLFCVSLGSLARFYNYVNELYVAVYLIWLFSQLDTINQHSLSLHGIATMFSVQTTNYTCARFLSRRNTVCRLTIKSKLSGKRIVNGEITSTGQNVKKSSLGKEIRTKISFYRLNPAT